MRIRFDGKTVVVSGVGHGFGRCIATSAWNLFQVPSGTSDRCY
jgi:hypothetical protein